jgi:hypothetical protein
LLDAEQVEQEARRAADLIIGYHRQMGDRGGGPSA